MTDSGKLERFNLQTMSGVFPGSRTRSFQRLKLRAAAQGAPPTPLWAQLLWYDEPVGCVALERAGEEACYMGRLAVLPAHREKGIGSALVNHIIVTARSSGAKRVEIGIVAEQEGLRRWYEGRGFRGVETKHYDHLPFAVLHMRREL